MWQWWVELARFFVTESEGRATYFGIRPPFFLITSLHRAGKSLAIRCFEFCRFWQISKVVFFVFCRFWQISNVGILSFAECNKSLSPNPLKISIPKSSWPIDPLVLRNVQLKCKKSYHRERQPWRRCFFNPSMLVTHKSSKVSDCSPVNREHEFYLWKPNPPSRLNFVAHNIQQLKNTVAVLMFSLSSKKSFSNKFS